MPAASKTKATAEWTAVAELVKEFPVVVTTLVTWGDMDANRHVNHTVYFRYMEHARVWYFRELGFTKLREETGIGPILAWADDYDGGRKALLALEDGSRVIVPGSQVQAVRG